MRRRTAVAAVALALIGAAAVPGVASAQLPPNRIVPLQVTGPTTERLNLVILGDGYTAAEMQKFRDQVDKHLNIQWSFEPFKSYRNYFNVYMIEVESPVSGISCDPDDGNVRRATPLRLQYAATCPAEPNARGITFGSGGTRGHQLARRADPGRRRRQPADADAGQHEHLRRHRRHRRDDVGRLAAGPADQPARARSLAGRPAGRVPVLGAQRPGRGRTTGGEPTSIHHTSTRSSRCSPGS